MEEENEQLDWGNEDDELQHQDLHRKSSAADFDRGELGDVDDAEDSVSLGDDEDEQGYYAYQQQDPNGGTDVLSYRDANPKSVSTPKSATFPTSQQNPQEHKRESSTTSQKHSSTAGSPSRHQQAANQHTSPGPRSQAISTRMTHALPPKPVVTNVPFLHPSHPSIVEATAMSRTVGRSESNKNKTNGASATISTSAGSGKPGSSGVVDPESLPLLPNWEVRHPRNGSRGVYYYNVETHESTWSRPVSSSNSTLSLKEPRGSSARRRRASSVSVTGRPPSPLRSDHSVDPSLRSVRAPPLPQLEFDVTDPQESSQLENTLSLAGLSYEDRHYRPAGGDGIPAAPDARRGDVDLPDPRFNPNPRTAFTPPVSPRVREHPRSLSPVPHVPPQQRGRDLRSRGSQRSARGARNANTNAEPSMQKDHDARPAPSISPGRHWIPAPRPLPVEHATNASQGSRRQQRHQGPYKPDVDPTFELSAFQDSDRPTTRTGGVRSRNRDRDQPRVDSRERQNQSQSMPAPRHRSPRPHPHDGEQDFNISRDYENLPTLASLSTPTAVGPAPPAQKQRDRPSRFDRPSTSAAPVVTTVTDPALTTAEQALPPSRSRDHDVYVPADVNAPHQRRGSERDRDRHPEHDVERDELTISSSKQIAPSGNGDASASSLYLNKRVRTDDRDVDRDRAPPSDPSRSSPVSETPPGQPSRRKRAPLPPQSARFREVATRPKPVLPIIDQSSSQNHTTARLSPVQGTTSVPSGPRDQQQRSVNTSLPSGPRHQTPSQPHGEIDGPRRERAPPSGPLNSNFDRDSSRQRGDRRVSDTPYAQTQSLAPPDAAMDVDVDETPSFSSRTAALPAMRDNTNRGSGMYADKEASSSGGGLPKGPRAMASKPSASSSVGAALSPVASTSPTTPFSVAGRIRDRSPPPHLGVRDGYRDRDARQDTSSHWRDSQPARLVDPFPPMDRAQGRWEIKGRPGEFSRPGPLSGTNSVPIGTRKGGASNGNGFSPAPPITNRYGASSVPAPPLGISTTNMEPIRNNRMRGPAPVKESYERPSSQSSRSFVDSYRPRMEAEDAGSRRRSIGGGSPPPTERRPISPANDLPRRDPQYPNRFNRPSSQDRAAAPRIWTPREPSPAPVPASHTTFDGDGNHRAVTPPPLSREPSLVSSAWDPDASFTSDRPSTGRHTDSVQHPEGSRGKAPDVDGRKRQRADDLIDRARFVSGPEVRKGGSLEGRLGERYDDRYVEPKRQLHGLPPNPSLHRDHDSYVSNSRRQAHLDDRRRPGSFLEERSRSNWGDDKINDFHSDRSRTLEGPGVRSELEPEPRTSKPVRIRRPPPTANMYQDDPMRLDSRMDDPPLPVLHSKEHAGDLHDQMSSRSQHLTNSRRGGSLLDRLSFDHHHGNSGSGGDGADLPPPPKDISSPSLRERVQQVPAKRDREDMMGSGDRYAIDPSFDGDDIGSGDPASKRMRRRSGKPRRGGVRRGS